MSRTAIAFSMLTTILTGCQCFDYAKYSASLATARVESMAPHKVRPLGTCREWSNCIPHRPWTPGYNEDKDYDNTQHTAQRCAFDSLEEYRTQNGRPISHHFKMGFIAAYEDLALNRRPSPPVAPPPKYWNAYYRSAAGKPLVEEWFAGYDAGLQMGMNSGVAQFNEVYLRRFNRAEGPAVNLNYDQAAVDESAPQQAQFPSLRSVNPVNYLFGPRSQ